MEMSKAEAGPEPRKETFSEKAMSAEPKSDVKMTMVSGMTLRERVRVLQSGTGASYLFTYTKLDANDVVVTDSDGNALVSPAHEVVVNGEEATRLGAAGLAKALKAGREIAAARAVDHFNGLDLLPKLMADRLG